MPRQITDEEWNFLQGKRQIADFAENLYNDPELSRELKGMIKKKHPQMRIDDYDLEQRVEEKLAAERREREEQENARRNEEDQKHFQSVRKRTQEQYGFTDQAMQDLEKLMVERNVGDYDVAAQYMASKEPKPSDTSFDHDGRWHHEKVPGFAEIAKDPEDWGRNEILKALRNDEARNKQQRF
jgi:hypothetical protein